MLSKLLSRRPSHATVVAYLALFVALGGTTYAAATIGAGDIKNDAVRSRHIKNGQVKNPDLAPNSVGGGKVINNSLTGADVNEGTLGRVPLAANAQHAAAADRLQGKTLSSWGFPTSDEFFGPLPKEQPFTSQGGRLLLLVTGSAFRSSYTAGRIGVTVKVDGVPVSYFAGLANELSSHKQLSTLVAPLDVGAGDHTVRLEPLDSGLCRTGGETSDTYCTTTDGGDLFTINVIEFPRP